jgi:hypothetical protein
MQRTSRPPFEPFVFRWFASTAALRDSHRIRKTRSAASSSLWSKQTPERSEHEPTRSQSPVPQVERVYASCKAPLTVALTRIGPAVAVARNTARSAAKPVIGRTWSLPVLRVCQVQSDEQLSPQDGSHMTIAHDSEPTTPKQPAHRRRGKAGHKVGPPFPGGLPSVALTPTAAHAPTRASALHSQRK